ncbi:trypsin-like peptidase domain-containing protein [Fluviicola taffensis]|uniref:Serine protease n=1 Tax=Fluviicola taffensis (strain DSM 16823 / NCIMB 13979 / RW262) TaxID=755732 RepID=F2IFV1_FLUTR|nr:trypsin-like peptidase domain-containing protein [Fluviicola taffensis]AEA42559.1 hypothetical protein Fluta_0554 [Fluviicola taffensis DSM 16823]
MNKINLLFFLLIGITLSCSSSEKKAKVFYFSQLQQTQYLLTNQISMKNRGLATGASSYLLELYDSTYLVTAKHLTRDAMGFSPALDLETYSDSVNFWYGLSRTSQLSLEIIETTDLLYCDEIMDDLIMLRVKDKPKEIGIFQPNFKRLKKGDRVSIIACEYSDIGCNQKQYFGTFQQYTVVDQMEVFMDSSNIEPAGMSGAPVVDDQFKVVGHVLAGGVGDKGILKLYLAPIDLVKRIKLIN